MINKCWKRRMSKYEYLLNAFSNSSITFSNNYAVYSIVISILLHNYTVIRSLLVNISTIDKPLRLCPLPSLSRSPSLPSPTHRGDSTRRRDIGHRSPRQSGRPRAPRCNRGDRGCRGRGAAAGRGRRSRTPSCRGCSWQAKRGLKRATNTNHSRESKTT